MKSQGVIIYHNILKIKTTNTSTSSHFKWGLRGITYSLKIKKQIKTLKPILIRMYSAGKGI